MSREDQYAVSVRVGPYVLGIFDSFDGGEVDSEETKHRPGGMQRQKSLGGPVSVGNVTVSRNYELERDHNMVPLLEPLVGKADMVVTKQPLDVNGIAYGKPLTYSGKFKQLNPPNHDSNSSDAAMIELEQSSVTMT
jgi:hypothetical protein